MVIAGRLGLLAALCLPATIAGLTIVQAPFMRTLGWDPVRAPTMDWPSGLALGPYGVALTVQFVAAGGALFNLADGAARWLRTRALRIARPMRLALSIAALGMVGLAFPTDPTLTTRVATWHGRLHDLSYVLLGLGLSGAAIAGIVGSLAAGKRGIALALGLSVLVVATGFVLKGWLLYLAFAMIFCCIATLAWAMIRKA
jgi:hypothetical protein